MSLIGSASLQTSSAEIVPINQNHMNAFHTHLVPSRNRGKISSIKDIKSKFSKVLNSKKVSLESQPDYDLVEQTDLNSPKEFDNDNISLMETKVFSCGDYVEGEIDTSKGQLTIRLKKDAPEGASGAMKNYSALDEDYPDWHLDKYREYVTSIVIENGVTTIGNCAFLGCESSITVSIPSSVKSIGDSAFHKCTNLNTVSISEGVETIGPAAFMATSLCEIIIPNSITTIGSGAFKGCCSLSCVTIGEGVTTIKDSAFKDCIKLYSVGFCGKTVPTGYASNSLPFSGDNELKEVYVPENYEGTKFCELKIVKKSIDDINKCRTSIYQKFDDLTKKLEKLEKYTKPLNIAGAILGGIGALLGVYNSISKACKD